jgi:hypothetical protein
VAAKWRREHLLHVELSQAGIVATSSLDRHSSHIAHEIADQLIVNLIMGKKKGAKKQDASAGEDDWDILNEAVAEVEETTADAPAKESENTDAAANNGMDDAAGGAVDAAAAFLAAQGISADGGGGKDTKKKKKKKKGASDKADKPADEKVSAKGKLIAERLARQREEEERLAAAQEAERLRVEEIERKEREEEERIQVRVWLDVYLKI